MVHMKNKSMDSMTRLLYDGVKKKKHIFAQYVCVLLLLSGRQYKDDLGCSNMRTLTFLDDSQSRI